MRTVTRTRLPTPTGLTSPWQRFAALMLVGAGLLAFSGCNGGNGEELPLELEVKRGDETLAEWNAERMRAELEIREVRLAGDTFAGPLFVDLMAASAVEEWQTVAVVGKGPQLRLDVSQIVAQDVARDREYLLAIRPDGTFRLVAPGLHESLWVRRVSSIELPE